GPERGDVSEAACLSALRGPDAVVIHATRAQEFDAGVDAALARLRATGALRLNQALLLRGVNDSLDAQAALHERSFAAGVLPYYLHQLDRVAGAAHFEVRDAEALAVRAAPGGRLPGCLVPCMVRGAVGGRTQRGMW